MPRQFGVSLDCHRPGGECQRTGNHGIKEDLRRLGTGCGVDYPDDHKGSCRGSHAER